MTDDKSDLYSMSVGYKPDPPPPAPSVPLVAPKGYEPLPRNEDYRWPMPAKRCAAPPVETDDRRAQLNDTLRDLTGRSALDLLEEWIKSQRDMPPATLEAFAMRISRHADEIERAERKITQMGRESR